MSHRPPPSRRSRRDPDQPAPPAQPPIWAEGRQAPPFALGAFLRVSHLLARRSLGPRLDRFATTLQRVGDSWLSGVFRVDCARLGRAAAIIPSHHDTGRGILALARLTRDAARIVLPGPEPDLPLAYPDLLTPRQNLSPLPRRPQHPPARQPTDTPAGPEEPILLFIRGLLDEDADEAETKPNVVQLHPKVDPVPRPAPASNAVTAVVSALIRRALSPVLAYGLIGLFLIPGAVRAFLLHLDGTDLRNSE